MEPSTDELIDRWIAGDEKAAEGLYRRYHDRVRRFARHLLGSDFDADDIADEAILAGLTGVRTQRPERFTSWLLGIANNLSQRKFREKLKATDSMDKIPTGSGARTLAIRSEMDEVLKRILRELPAPQRQVMELSYNEGLSREEIADRLGIPLKAVHSRFTRSKEFLQSRLAEHFTSVVLLKSTITWREIEALRPAFREAVVARHLEERSLEEAAKRLSQPAATVADRLKSAYLKLKCGPDADFTAARAEWRKKNDRS